MSLITQILKSTLETVGSINAMVIDDLNNLQELIEEGKVNLDKDEVDE